MRVPGHRGRHVRRGEGGDDVGVGGVDDLDVLLGEADRLEAARQQVVGDRQLDEVDRWPLMSASFLLLPLSTMPSLPLE